MELGHRLTMIGLSITMEEELRRRIVPHTMPRTSTAMMMTPVTTREPKLLDSTTSGTPQMRR